MAERKQAIMVGALEAIGRYIVERLRKQKHRPIAPRGRAAPRYRHISVDLGHGREARRLGGKRHTYVAFQPAAGAAAGHASNIAPNRDIP
jgi:NAD(P)-dependent dehydrogenase (short-subunit alcohol dehydrogenase family)